MKSKTTKITSASFIYVIFLAVLVIAGVVLTTINSPVDNFIKFNSSLTPFNCSATTTSGTIANMSWWYNGTGVWHRNQTVDFGVDSDAHGVDFVSGGTTNGAVGTRIVANDAITTTSFFMGIAGNTTVDTCYLTTSAEVTLETASISGGRCTFDFDLVSGTTYLILTNRSDGANFERNVTDGSVSNIGGTFINWTSGWAAGATSNAIRNIVNFSIDTSSASANNVFTQNITSVNLWTCSSCDSENVCDFAENRTIRFIDIQENFNSTTFETVTETYIINLSSSPTISSVALLYNGTSVVSTQSGDIFTSSRDISSSDSGNNTLQWNVTSGGQSFLTDFFVQNVQGISLGLCNASLTVPFINFTFKNETLSQESISASIASTFSFWIDNAPENRTISFIDAAENISYQFCAFPEDRTLNLDYSIAYTNSISQQRVFSNAESVTNSTVQKTLYLLPTTLGLFTQFQTIDSLGNPIALVKGIISRTIGSSTFIAASSFTDSSGIVTYFLNPDATYSALFTVSGFLDNIFSFVPITDQRVVIMGTVGGEINGSQIGLNTTYFITPTGGSLQNNTDVVFGFNVSTSQSLSLISMNITNSSGSQLGFNSSSSQGLITLTINTGNQTRIGGTFIIQTSDETLTIPRSWVVGNEFVGTYSIFNQLDVFIEYGFQDFLRLMMVIFVIMGVMIFMSSDQITDISESKVIVALLLVWSFSVVGWLDNPVVIANSGIAQFSKQYGIAILSTAVGSYFILRRIFIRRI